MPFLLDIRGHGGAPYVATDPVAEEKGRQRNSPWQLE